MRIEYRLTYTATFDTEEELEKAYKNLDAFFTKTAVSVATYKRADLTKDSYPINDPPVSKRLI